MGAGEVGERECRLESLGRAGVRWVARGLDTDRSALKWWHGKEGAWTLRCGL